MENLKLICQAIVSLGHQVWHFPRSVMGVIQQRRQQIVLDKVEAERLDRIRNPSKYLGK